MTDKAEKIQADIEDATARYKEAYNDGHFELANNIQKQINILCEESSRLAAYERSMVFLFLILIYRIF